MQELVPCCDLFTLFLARIRRLREVRWNKTKTYSFYCCPSVLFLSQNVHLRGRKSSQKHFLYIKRGLNRQNLIFFLSALLKSETWSLRILATGNYLSILPYGVYSTYYVLVWECNVYFPFANRIS